jgi:hypothetical protein
MVYEYSTFPIAHMMRQGPSSCLSSSQCWVEVKRIVVRCVLSLAAPRETDVFLNVMRILRVFECDAYRELSRSVQYVQ